MYRLLQCFSSVQIYRCGYWRGGVPKLLRFGTPPSSQRIGTLLTGSGRVSQIKATLAFGTPPRQQPRQLLQQWAECLTPARAHTLGSPLLLAKGRACDVFYFL